MKRYKNLFHDCYRSFDSISVNEAATPRFGYHTYLEFESHEEGLGLFSMLLYDGSFNSVESSRVANIS